jgi:hypothetical protein
VIPIVGDVPLLQVGMTVADVRQRLGEPASIKSMPSQEVVAETWIYYFEKPLGPTTIFNGATSMASGGSLAGDYGRSGLGPDYLVAQRKLLVTLRLLMVNGQLAAQAASSEERLEF